MRLIPVDLPFLTPVIALRNAYFATLQPHGELLLPDIAAHGGFGDRMAGMLCLQTSPDPMGRVPLFARGLPILFQDPVDDRRQWSEFGLFPFGHFAFGRDRVADRLPDHAAMYAVFPGQSLDRLSGRVLPPDRLK